MTNTLHSIYEYDYTGQVDFAAPSHQQASDIVVLVNDVVKSQASDYTLAGRVVTFTGFTPSNGDKIIVRRETASAARQVNFVSGSMLKADTLDQDSDQIFNIAQEALDKAVMIGGDYNARYYGATLVAPTTPTPSDGDLWFDTSANVMKVYNASASSWSSLTLTAEDQASIDTVAGITSEVQTVAANVTGINHYGRTFLGSSANAPSAYPDGTALVIGALWFDSSVNIMKVYQANGWHNIATAVVNPINRKSFVASAGQTAFSMAYEAGHVDVFLNGVKLVESTATVNNDFVATSGTSVVLNTGAAAGDTIEIVADTISPLTNVVTGDAGTDASYNSLTGVITVPRGDTGATGASVTTANVTAAGAAMLTGADFTGDISFGDGLNINIGTGDDLKLYHLSDNNASYIHNAGVGGLVTRTNKLYIKSENNSKQMLSAFENAHVGLYHDGDLKFKTTSTGIDVDGNIAVSSGATFTGDITAESKLIAKKIPVASDLLTTSRSIQDLAAWSTYGGIGSNYALTPEKYRDALDVNQDKRFSSADASGINSFVAANYSSTEHDTYISLVGNQSNITSTFIQDVLDGDYDIDCVVIDKDASSIVTVSGDIAVSGTVDGRDILADGGKLDLIEASADVTDTTNVTSAGAAMLDSSPTFTGAVTADTFTGGDTVLTQTGILSSDAVLTLRNADSGGISAPHLLFDRVSGSPADDDGIGSIVFQGRNSANGNTPYVYITGKADDVTNNTEDGQLQIYARKAGANVLLVDLTSEEMSLTNGTSLDVEGGITTPSLNTSTLDATNTSPSQNTPVLKLRKNSASANGTGRFITLNSSTTSGGSDITRGLIGLSNTSSPQYSHPYMSHTSGSIGIMCTHSGNSSYSAIAPCSSQGIASNSSLNLGHAYAKWHTVYSSSATINTSDMTKKQDIEELSEAENRVAVAAKGLLRKYRWKEAVAEKGDNARIHFGIMAQDLKAAFEAEGLDAHKYGMFCADTRWTTDGTDTYATEEEALEAVSGEETPEAVTEETVYGVRYEELLTFIIAAL